MNLLQQKRLDVCDWHDPERASLLASPESLLVNVGSFDNVIPIEPFKERGTPDGQ